MARRTPNVYPLPGGRWLARLWRGGQLLQATFDTRAQRVVERHQGIPEALVVGGAREADDALGALGERPEDLDRPLHLLAVRGGEDARPPGFFLRAVDQVARENE